MKASIVICTYNNENTIGKAIRSAIDQRFSKDDFEVLVVNDGSTDGTKTVIKAIANYEPRIRVITHDTNLGLPASKNTAIRASYGGTWMSLDADGDWLPPNTLSHLYDALLFDREAAYAWGGYAILSENGDFVRYSIEREGSGVLFRKEALEHIGLFDETLRVWEDKDMYRKMDAAGLRGVFVPMETYKYVQTPQSLTRGGLTAKQTAKELQKIIDKVERVPVDGSNQD